MVGAGDCPRFIQGGADEGDWRCVDYNQKREVGAIFAGSAGEVYVGGSAGRRNIG